MRTLAHRYGGGAFAVGDQLVYSRASDGRVCRLARDGPGEPTPITPSDERTVLGGPAESVFQPSWRGDELYAVSDRTGWWNIYRVVPDLEPVVDEPAELGFSSYEHASLATDGTRLVAHAGSPTQPRSILRWTPGETPTVLRASEAFTFADCNYRGSTGHGRAYRDALDGEWGRKDTADCINVARYLGGWEVGDPDRTAIRGASAGGFATLAALTVADTFDAGSSYFGVADLRALAEHTHKFESRYLDTLVGPLPDAADTYADRSPLEHADQIDAPTLLLQAGNDAVVTGRQRRCRPPGTGRTHDGSVRRNRHPLRLRSVSRGTPRLRSRRHETTRARNRTRILQAVEANATALDPEAVHSTVFDLDRTDVPDLARGTQRQRTPTE